MELNFVGKLNGLSINNNELAFLHNGDKADFYLYSKKITIGESPIKVNRINFNLSEIEPNTSLTLSLNNDRVISDNDDFMIIDLFFDKAFMVFRCTPELDAVGDYKLVDDKQKSIEIEYFSSKSSVISYNIKETANITKYPQIIDIWVIEYDEQKENVLQWIYENVAI